MFGYQEERKQMISQKFFTSLRTPASLILSGKILDLSHSSTETYTWKIMDSDRNKDDCKDFYKDIESLCSQKNGFLQQYEPSSSSSSQQHNLLEHINNDSHFANPSKIHTKNLKIVDECRKRKILGGNEQIVNEDLKHGKGGNSSDDEDIGLSRLFDTNTEEKSTMKKKKGEHNRHIARPNYFLAVRIKKKSIHQKVEEIHTHIKSINKIFQHAFVPVPTLHLTLMVMTLNDTQERQKAIDALSLSSSDISNIVAEFDKKIIKFKGLNNFGGQVVFIDAKESEDCSGIKLIHELVNIFKSSFKELSVQFKDEPFVPHVTLMKMSKCSKIMKKAGIKRIPSAHYRKYENFDFGCEEISSVELCSMNDKKSSDGFYKVLAKVEIDRLAVVSLPKGEVESVDVMDLTSYEVIPNWSRELKNFKLDSSWHKITEEEINESKIETEKTTYKENN